MRKIDEQAARAFLLLKKLSSNNTKVEIGKNCQTARIILFGHTIAKREVENAYFTIRTCGWNSVTTKSRLNALPNVHIKVIKGTWYLKEI